jgi:hypothetical protein
MLRYEIEHQAAHRLSQCLALSPHAAARACCGASFTAFKFSMSSCRTGRCRRAVIFGFRLCQQKRDCYTQRLNLVFQPRLLKLFLFQNFVNVLHAAPKQIGAMSPIWIPLLYLSCPYLFHSSFRLRCVRTVIGYIVPKSDHFSVLTDKARGRGQEGGSMKSWGTPQLPTSSERQFVPHGSWRRYCRHRYGTEFFASLEWLDFPRRFAYRCHNISATLVKLFAYLTKAAAISSS